jgi:hypothetical protein
MLTQEWTARRAICLEQAVEREHNFFLMVAQVIQVAEEFMEE